MINIRQVREEVQARLSALRTPATEETIHELYSKVLLRAMEEACYELEKLDRLVEQTRCHHPQQGWIMVTSEQREELHRRIRCLHAYVSVGPLLKRAV